MTKEYCNNMWHLVIFTSWLESDWFSNFVSGEVCNYHPDWAVIWWKIKSRWSFYLWASELYINTQSTFTKAVNSYFCLLFTERHSVFIQLPILQIHDFFNGLVVFMTSYCQNCALERGFLINWVSLDDKLCHRLCQIFLSDCQIPL